MKCCICGHKIKGYGNNPDGAMWPDEDGTLIEGKFNESDRCCDECNNKFVLLGRLYKLKMKENK